MLQVFGLVVLVATIIMAYRWGGRDERFAAGAFAIATFASRVLDAGNFQHVQISILVVDVVLFGALLVLALGSDRFWPIWAAAFQLVGTTVHVASMAETGDFAWAYAVGLIFWTYPVLISLMLGTWLEARYRRN